jgi:multiple sugar transport system ATP-binding protein
MASVELKGIGKIYDGGVRAVEDVNLVIEDGEFVVLVGPSGCGKSTTLRMVAGLEDITEGDLSIDGKRVNEVAARDRDIAMVFQNYALYPHLDVRSNLSFGLERRRKKLGLSRDDIAKKVEATAANLGIKNLLERLPKQLSGGQRQRVAVGRALVRDPAVFLLDEPLSNLDARLRVETRAELRMLHRQLQATMLYVTHDQEEAMSLGDRMVVMHQGRVQQVGRPMDIYAKPANRFVAGFVGSPAMNFIEGEIRADGSCCVFESDAGASIPVPAVSYRGNAVLGVRPERLILQEQFDEHCWPAEVVAVERYGDRGDALISLTGMPTRLVARSGAMDLPDEGVSVGVSVPSEHVHLFEPGECGRRLCQV